MRKKKEIDPEFYETHDFSEDLEEAKRTGNLIVTGPGESTIEAVRRHMLAKKKSGGGLSAARAAVPVAARGG